MSAVIHMFSSEKGIALELKVEIGSVVIAFRISTD